MDQAQTPLPAGPEHEGDLAVNRCDAAQEGGFRVASTQTVGEAMIGWDTDWRGGFWAPPSEDASRDLPPLRLRDHDGGADLER